MQVHHVPTPGFLMKAIDVLRKPNARARRPFVPRPRGTAMAPGKGKVHNDEIKRMLCWLNMEGMREPGHYTRGHAKSRAFAAIPRQQHSSSAACDQATLKVLRGHQRP